MRDNRFITMNVHVLNKIVKKKNLNYHQTTTNDIDSFHRLIAALSRRILSACEGAADGFISGSKRVAWKRIQGGKIVKVYFLSPSGVSAITNILFVFVGIFVHSFAKFSCFRSNSTKGYTPFRKMFETCSK